MASPEQRAPAPDFLRKPVLTGHAVRLRPLTGDDLPALLPMLRDAETRRLTGSTGGREPEESWLRAWYGSRRYQDGRLDLAVVERATGAVAGEAVLNDYDAGARSCNFRISLVPGAVGRGLGTEASRLLVGHGFGVLGLRRVSLEVYPFNPRARRAYEKAGFVAERLPGGASRPAGEPAGAVPMRVLAEEWERHRGHPEG